jgi:hypothetical protein
LGSRCGGGGFALIERYPDLFEVDTKKPQNSPLRCAPVEMTKGRAALPEREVAEREPLFITFGQICEARSRIEGESCGIPHLAKNEPDVGSETERRGRKIERKSATG